jgi:hypothetical protein
VGSLNSIQGNAYRCKVQLASKPKLAIVMNMEEYTDERGLKSTGDTSSHSEGSNYETKEDAKRSIVAKNELPHWQVWPIKS